MADTSSFVAAVLINGFIGGAVLIAFECVRTRDVDIYAPKSRGLNPSAPRPRPRLWSLFLQVYNFSDDKMLIEAGMDGYVYLRFLLFCGKVCSFLTMGACVLMPVYYYAHGVDGGLEFINKLSMANISQQGFRLWISASFMYIFTFTFLHLIYLEYENFMHARNKFFLGVDKQLSPQMSFTILVENIPEKFRTGTKLKHFFESVFPGEVLHAAVEVSMPEMEDLIKERDELRVQLEYAIAEFESSHKTKRPKITLIGGKYNPSVISLFSSGCSCWTPQQRHEEVDKIDFLSDQLALLCEEVHVLQRAAHAVADDDDEEEEKDKGEEREGSPDDNDVEHGQRAEGVRNKGSSTFSSFSSIGNGYHRNPHRKQKGNSISFAIQEEPPTHLVDVSTPLHREVDSRVNYDATSSSSIPGQHQHHQQEGDDATVVTASTGSTFTQRLKTGSFNSAVSSAVDKSKASTTRNVRKLGSLLNDYVASQIASATGFVTFKSRRAHVAASQVLVLSQEYPQITTSLAPEPSDIIWTNVSASPEYTANVEYLTATFYYTGLLFWSVVLAVVAALSQLSTLERYLPLLKDLNPLFTAVLQALLPVIVVILFGMFLPWLMTYTATSIEKRKTHSAVQQEVFKWFFMYSLANVYLLLLGGSIFTSFEDAVNDPGSILKLISAALPTVAVFFINFVTTSWLGGIPSQLLQVGPSAIIRLYRYLLSPLSVTFRMLKEGPFAQQEVDYGTTLPGELYILCIVLLYWIIAPLILPISAGYFMSAYFALKYKYIFMVTRSYESGGQFWYGLYANAMTALMFASITMITYMGIKKGTNQVIMLAPLPVIIIYYWRLTEKHFKLRSSYLPYDTAVHRDNDRTEEEHETLLSTFTESFLQQPSVSGPHRIYPYPHRLLNTPLLRETGAMYEIYLNNALEEGVDPALFVQQIKEEGLNAHWYETTAEAGAEAGKTSEATVAASVATMEVEMQYQQQQ